ncbi:MAG: stalk domain-containing protein [Syntrophomonadaceae bacterium]|nr:stalk domain-containing protein [Syntrophomonadaceae bacterium]
MVNQAGAPEIIEVNIIKNMKVKAVLINGETYVHLRNFVAAMNGVVDWDADKRQALVM